MADCFVTVGSGILITYLICDVVREIKQERRLRREEAELEAAEEKQNDGRED